MEVFVLCGADMLEHMGQPRLWFFAVHLQTPKKYGFHRKLTFQESETFNSSLLTFN